MTEPFRLRFSIKNSGALSADPVDYDLYVSRNGGTYQPVTTVSNYVVAADAGASVDDTVILIPRLSLP